MRIWKGLLLGVLLLMFFGCPPKESQKTAAPTAMPDSHSAIFAEKCAKCHDLTRVDEAHKTKTKVQMQDIIKRMKEKPGSGISESDLSQLINLY